MDAVKDDVGGSSPALAETIAKRHPGALHNGYINHGFEGCTGFITQARERSPRLRVIRPVQPED